jgi:hypothetical protein
MDRDSVFWLWVMGLAGVLIVAGLAMLGVNLASSARTGPRWKRKLVAAGLILLGMGVGSGVHGYSEPTIASSDEPMPQRTDMTMSPSATAEQNVMWTQVVTAWQEGREIAGRTRIQIQMKRKRTYRQTKAEEDALLAALVSARKNVQTLTDQKMLSKRGAKLLTDDLNQFTRSVPSYRPEREEGWISSCYLQRILPTRQAVSLTRLNGRLVTIEKLVASGTLKPGPAAQVAAIIRRDAIVLREPIYQARMELELHQRARARELVTRADALLAKLPAPPKSPSMLERSAQWKQVQAVRTLAQRYAKNGSTQAQRTAFDKLFEQANAATEILSNKGMVSLSAAELFRDELTQCKRSVYADPPKDFSGTCYLMAISHPAAESMKRLTRRLDLLDSMLRNDRLRPETIRALLPSLERDLAVLSDPKQIALLPDSTQAKGNAVTVELFNSPRSAAKKMKERAEKTIATLHAYIKRNTP